MFWTKNLNVFSSVEQTIFFTWTFGLLLVDFLVGSTAGTMPYHDEEYPGQPLWQSVLLFCCKGMIEGIMVILFFWLLVQVLFTKQLEGMVSESKTITTLPHAITIYMLMKELPGP